MALDSICISALTAELCEKLAGSKIDKIYQPEKDEIVVHARTRDEHFRVVLSASPAHPRVHFTDVSKKNPATAPMFCMLLRKQLGGGTITGISQEGFERVIKISVQSRNELGDIVTKYLIAEIMGRHSNIILTDENMKIIDSIKRVDFTISTVRQILPGLPYAAPPAQSKTPLTNASTDIFIDFDTPQKAYNALMGAISGISPLSAREIVYRVFGTTDITTPEMNLNKKSALKAEVIRFADRIRRGDFSPCLIAECASGKFIDFSAFEIRQYESAADIIYTDTVSEMLDKFYSMRDMRERMRQKSAGLIKLLNNNIERVSKKLIILDKTVRDAKNKDKYKLYGELVTAELYRIKDGDTCVNAVNYYDAAMPEISVPLDAQLSPSQNAQRYFKKYSKAKIAETEAAKQTVISKNELDYLESTLAAVETAETEDDLNAIRAELEHEGYLSVRRNTKKAKRVRSEPMHFVSSDGFDIYVGKNNTQNDFLTMKLANSSDIWFHTKNIHGSHTVIKLGQDKNVPRTTMLEAAQLAAYYSKARESSQVPVDYTKIANVKKPGGTKPGMVIYDSYNTLYVTPKKL